VKGADWEGRLPPEQLSACGRVGTEIVYIPTPKDSSTARLRAWALADADRSLDRLEAFMSGQDDADRIANFDTGYFTGDWRTTTEAYTWEGRKKAEGRHPKIVKECFEGLTVLDVGCGPGYFVRMLREVGMDAGGVDPSPDAIALSNGFQDRVVCGHVSQMPPKIAHVAICREVLEHLTVYDVPALVGDLFRVARKFVYITTRFSSDGVFDAATDFETDPTHISLLSQPFVRSLCVLNGGKRRRDLETKLDHMNKGRVLVYGV
jgi:SAM-dependent methyltransferase